MAYSDRCSDFDRSNLVVLQHLDEVDPFVALHKEIIAKKYRDQGVCRTDAKVTREHNSTFLHWFKEHIIANPPEEGSKDGFLIYALAQGPSPNLVTIRHMISMDTRSTRRPKIWRVMIRTQG